MGTEGNVGSKKKSKRDTFKELAENFEQLLKHPDRYLKPQPESIEAIYQLIQQTYSVCIKSHVDSDQDFPSKLVLEDMDDEQIWQQLEMRNNFVLGRLSKQTAQLIDIGEQQLGIELDDDEDPNEQTSEQESMEEKAEDEEDQSELEDSDNIDKQKSTVKSSQIKAKRSKKGRNSVVDDTFFKLDEMKQFLEQEDAKEMRKHKNNNPVDESETINHFAEDFGVLEDSDDDENGANANFGDFFEMDDELQEKAQKLKTATEKDYFNESESEPDKEDNEDIASEIDEADFVAQSGVQPASDPESESNHENNASSEDEAEEPAMEAQSSNEMREARLLQRIRDYEDVVLGEKPWQYKGEVQAGNRPQNSLLEEILEFDSTARPSAPLTDEQNRTIEDIIKQRIRDKAWDDVERTVRPVHTPQEYRKQLVLDQEKSKQSLAQIYEQQYHRELDKLNPNRDEADGAAPEPKEHQEIKRAMRSLFLKLDALSNYHFTPKPVAPEAKIVTNTPAVQMEEVAPVAVSDVKLLAPEEVFRGPKHTPLGKTERTRTDKNRERRKKKQKQRAINTTIEQREQQRAKEGKAPTKRETNAKLLKTITKSRNVNKITVSNDQGALKSSKAFFNKLQDKTTSTLASTGSKRPKKATSEVNAKKLKL
ncbi:U3 small nucleolar ribonucleoprotein protein MPP10 [Drosophila montana]|uniref:U3 small nucleolar ribonucleoprotein protein MPP10 n=1 Tax=Drosophila montana TaxID=40370 RepID=UPI00313C58C7